MKYAVTNNSQAPQGLRTVDGIRWIKPGATAELTLDDTAGSRAEAIGMAIDAVDEDGEPRTLADHTIAELRDIAKDEGVELGDSTKKADIVAAIELAREAKPGE